MTKFYRYLRPVQYNRDRNVIETKPHGGICFSVTPVEERRAGAPEGERLLLVAYSICPMDEAFNRSVAKRLADNGREWMIKAKSLSMIDIASSIVSHPDQNHSSLIDAVKAIHSSFRMADLDADIHKNVIEALQISKRYHDIQS